MNNQDPMVVAPADGDLRGDDRAMPNRGTGSGFVGMGSPYGADVAQGAINRQGGVDAGSDPMFASMPPGDVDRFSASGHTPASSGGRRFSAGSDGQDDRTPGDEGMAGDTD